MTGVQNKPLWSVASETRRQVEPSSLGESVVHYSIPSVDAYGIGQVESSADIHSNKLLLYGGEVLISKLNPRKSRVVIVSRDDLPIVSSTEFIGLQAGPQLEGRFLAYFLQSEAVRQHLDARVQSVTRSHQRVTPEDVLHLNIELPDLEEQRRIAEFLDAETSRIDRMLDASQRLLTLSAERRSVHRSFLMRGAEVRGARRVHPILGPLPSEWKVLPLKRLVPRIGVGVVVDPSSYFSEQGVPFLRGSNILEGAISTEGVKLMTEADSRQLWRSRLAEGDVVVVRAGYPGRAAVVPSTLEGANCASLVVIKKGESLLPGFLEAYFNSSLGQAYVNLVRYGAAQEQINVSHVVDFDVPVPPINAQKEILAELERAGRSVLALMRKAHDSRALLAERRRAVITAAVTGQFDVTTASGRNLTQGV